MLPLYGLWIPSHPLLFATDMYIQQAQLSLRLEGNIVSLSLDFAVLLL